MSCGHHIQQPDYVGKEQRDKRMKLYFSFVLSLSGLGLLSYGKKTYNTKAMITGAVLLALSFFTGF